MRRSPAVFCFYFCLFSFLFLFVCLFLFPFVCLFLGSSAGGCLLVFCLVSVVCLSVSFLLDFLSVCFCAGLWQTKLGDRSRPVFSFLFVFMFVCLFSFVCLFVCVFVSFLLVFVCLLFAFCFCAGLWQTKLGSDSPAGTKVNNSDPTYSSLPPRLKAIGSLSCNIRSALFASTIKSKQNTGKRESERRIWIWRGRTWPDAWLGLAAAGTMKMESQEAAAKCGNAEVGLKYRYTYRCKYRDINRHKYRHKYR